MQLLTLFIIVGIWLIVLTFFTVKAYIGTSKLSKEAGKTSFIKMIEDVLIHEKENRSEIEKLKKELTAQYINGQLHIQKVGLIKYNPFGEMGGGHSFSLTLLDANNSGILITGLHARDKTRLYLKSIVKGKSDLELSGEEDKALSDAIKGKSK